LPVQIEVGQRAPIAWFTFPDDGGLVAPRSSDVPIDAVDARIQGATDEPLRVRRVPVEDLRPLRKPVELLGEASPERLRVAIGASVDILVTHVRLRLKPLRRRERTVLLKKICNFCRWCVLGHSETG